MICDMCGEEYSDEFEFCPYCGTYPTMSCPNCLSIKKDNSKICSECGNELLPILTVYHYFNLEEEAYSYYKKGKYEKSRKIYEMILHDLPNIENIHFLLARNYRALGEYDKGLRQLEKLAEINPNYVGVWRGIGKEYFRQGDYEKAEEYLLKEHVIHPTERGHLIYLMFICFEKGDFKRANKILDYFFSINPYNFCLNFLNKEIENKLETGKYGQELFDINERVKDHMKKNNK